MVFLQFGGLDSVLGSGAVQTYYYLWYYFFVENCLKYKPDAAINPMKTASEDHWLSKIQVSDMVDMAVEPVQLCTAQAGLDIQLQACIATIIFKLGFQIGAGMCKI